MANIKSNIKRNKQSKKAYGRNKAIKSEIKTAIKKAKITKNPEDINNVVKLIDSAITKGAVHKNKSSRLVSKVQKLK